MLHYTQSSEMDDRKIDIFTTATTAHVCTDCECKDRRIRNLVAENQ